MHGASTGQRPASAGERTIVERAALPTLLFVLVAATAGIALQARRTESAHRETAERALRDYAAFAAWQYASLARQSVRHFAHISLQPLHVLSSAPAAPLVSPAILLRSRSMPPCDCGPAPAALFAFRLDLADGAIVDAVVVTGPDGRLAHDTTVRHVRSRLQLTVRRRPVPLFDERRPQSERVALDTMGGRAVAIAFSAVPGVDGRARAIYGVIADGMPIVDALEGIARDARLLPPALVGAMPNDSLLRVRVTNGTGMSFIGGGTSELRSFTASDTVGGSTDGLIASVTIHPSAADRLLIGGLPKSGFRVSMALFALAVTLIGIAYAQVRRWEQLAKLRGVFVANVSHELRTPLTQISMFSEMLLSDGERSREERRQFVSIINREARRLTNLVESVLRFSRAQTGGRTVRPELLLVVDEVYEALRAFAPISSAAHASIVVTHDDELLEAHVDPDAFRQVVLNLLDNAVKYGPNGQTIRIRVTLDDAVLRLAVSDEGPGIPAPSREQAVRPFVRLDSKAGKRTTGAGIGLSVVHDVATAHGGTVHIGEAPGAGACVTVTFPQPSPRSAVAVPA